jgi:hypothetical protein
MIPPREIQRKDRTEGNSEALKLYEGRPDRKNARQVEKPYETPDLSVLYGRLFGPVGFLQEPGGAFTA